MLIRDATITDWPLIWPFSRQIVAAVDTFTYDPEMDYAEGARRCGWLVHRVAWS